MYEAHQYFDLDHSGTYKTDYVLSNASPDRGVELVRPFAEWLKLRRTRGIVTEFGVPGDDPRWMELTQRLLVYLAQQNITSHGHTGPAGRGGAPTRSRRNRRMA